jgi:hypothetical protein
MGLRANAYLVASKREDGRYQELLDRLQRKGPGKQEPSTEVTNRKRDDGGPIPIVAEV